MQIDQRFVQNLQNQNNYLRNEVAKLNGSIKTLDEKYQKSLKQMSSIIHANQNLKQQLDNIKASAKDQIQGTIREVRANYEKRIQEIMKQKNDLNILNQNSMREKQQLQREYSSIERRLWQNQALKNQINSLKKQNQKLLIQTHSLTQNQENPEQKAAIQQKFTQKIEQLNNKIAQLNVQNTQAQKNIDSLQSEKQNFQRQIENMSKRNNELNLALQKSQTQIKKDEQVSAANKALQAKTQQIEVMDLRKKNAELLNQVERLKLEKLEMASQVNKTEAEMHLLGTLKSLHSQLEPMRYQIEELKRDKYFDRESTTKQKADLQMKLLSAQHELNSLKQYIKDIEAKSREVSQQLREKQWEKKKFLEIEEQKRILEGRVIVYEAMEMVVRNRDKPHHIERIQQFERRIHLLLEEQNLQYLVNNANVHQLIAMKAYIIELDNKLQLVIQQNQHFHKKYSQYKEKYQQVISENKQIISKHYLMVNAYKGKISGYERLVLKLTQQLERNLKDSQGPSTIESHYKSVITLYQSKIMNIHNQINAKKQENRDLLKKYDNIDMELKGKIALLRELQQELSNLKLQNKDLQTKLATRNLEQSPRGSLSNVPEDHYKRIITEKTKQILQLEQQLSKLKFKLDKMEYEHDRDLEGHKHRISRLEIEIQHLRLELSQSSKQIPSGKTNDEFGQLFAKINSLQKAVSKSQVTIAQPQPIANVGDYQRQIVTLRQQNQYLTRQLENLRGELKKKLTGSNININTQIHKYQDQINRLKDQANRQTIQLNNRILELEAELKLKQKQLQIKIRQIERLGSQTSHSQVTTIIQPNRNLELENSQLKAELQRIRGNYKQITQQSEQLMTKIREAQAYIGGLRQEFNNVSIKMGEYERELSHKDQQIHEWRIKFNNLQLQYDNDFSDAKGTANAVLDRNLSQKERRLNQMEHELERLKRQIDAKIRDLQRRELQANRRQSQIDSKSRQLGDRLRKVQERERIVTQQQNRLIHWSDQLERKQRNIDQTPARDIKNYQPQQRPSESPNRQQIIQLQRRIKRLEIQLSEKQKILEIKDEKLNRLIKQKSQLSRELEDLKLNFIEKERLAQQSQRNANSLRQEVARLEAQLQKLWKEYDILKQQLRNKQRQFSDAQLEIQELRRKLQLQKRNYNQRISDLQSRQSQQYSPPPIIKKPDYSQIQRQYEDRIRQIQDRNRQKIRQLYNQNEQRERQLQQTISDLSHELSKSKLFANNMNLTPTQNNTEVDGYKATIRSLQLRISNLEDDLNRKQARIDQLQHDLKYHKQTLALREEELQKLYESTHTNAQPSTSTEFDITQKIRLQQQIWQLQAQLQSKSVDRTTQYADHSQCIKKQHVLRMEIQRLNGMLLQSRLDKSQHSEKPITPQSQYIDTSYLNQLEDANRKLEQDILICRQRLLADFDQKRSIQQYLLILAITFAEVDALRQRIYELEQNFKEEHERQVNIIKQIDDLKDHDIDVEKILSLLRQLESSHRAFHEQESRSKTTYIQNINTKVLTIPGSNTISLNEELNKYGTSSSYLTQNPIPFNFPTTPFSGISSGGLGSSGIGSSIDTRRLQTGVSGSLAQSKPTDFGEISFGYNLNEDSSQSGLGLSGYVPGQSLSINKFNFTSSLGSSELGGTGMNTGLFGTAGGFNINVPGSSLPSPSFTAGITTTSPMKEISPISNIGSLSGSGLGATYGGATIPIGGPIQSGLSNQPGLSSQPFGSLSMAPLPPRPSSFSSSLNQPSMLTSGLTIPAGTAQGRRVQFSPGKQPQFESFSPSKPITLPPMSSPQQYPYYQPPSNEVSQNSLRYPSQSRLPMSNIKFGTSQTSFPQPYMIGSNQSIR